jgi:hypothetical protein
VEYIILFIVGTVISWLTLLVVMPVAQKIAQFSLPLWPERLWRLAIVAGATNLASVVLTPLSEFLAWIVGAIIFWVLLWKWFDLDFFGAVVIAIVSWFVQILITGVVMAALLSAF